MKKNFHQMLLLLVIYLEKEEIKKIKEKIKKKKILIKISQKNNQSQSKKIYQIKNVKSEDLQKVPK